MNKVFKDNNNEYTAKELIYAFGFDSDKYVGKISESEMMERLEGNHCECYGNGEFVLLPADHPDCVEGMKRYMQCRKCGGWSHL